MKTIELIKIFEKPLEQLHRMEFPIHYIQYRDMYNDFSRLVYIEGHKKTNAITWLADKFLLSESHIYKIIGLLEKNIDL